MTIVTETMRKVTALAVLVGLVVLTQAGNYAQAVPVSPGTPYVAVNPQTNRVYVTNTNVSGIVSVIKGSTSTLLTTIPLPSYPSGIAVNPVTNRIYVGSSAGVSVIDGATNTIIKTLPLGPGHTSLGVNPTTNRIYTNYANGGGVTVIDGATDTVIDTIDVGESLESVAVNATTNRIYTHKTSFSEFLVIDGATDTIVDTGPLPANSFPGIAVNPATNRIYISLGNGTVAVIDGATDSIIATPQTGPSAALAVNPKANLIYAPDWGGSSISIISGSTSKVLAAIPVGKYPAGVGVNTNTKHVYVGNGGSENVSIIFGNQRLGNPSFDGDKDGNGVPDGWAGVGLPRAGCLVGGTDNYDGIFSCAIAGEPGVSKEISQTVGLRTAIAGPTLVTLEGFSKREADFSWPGPYRISVEIHVVGGPDQILQVDFTKSNHGWERKAGTVRVDGDISGFLVRATYTNQVGTAYFDALHLSTRKARS